MVLFSEISTLLPQITLLALFVLSSSYDSLAAEFSRVSRFSAFCKNASRRTGVSSAVSPAFSAAHRMRDGIHSLSANMRPDAHMSHLAGFSDFDILIIRITQRANRRPALSTKRSHFTTRQNYCRPVTFPCHQFGETSCASSKFSALPCGHFNIMNLHSDRHRRQRHCIADLRLKVRAALYLLADRQSLRSKDISPL